VKRYEEAYAGYIYEPDKVCWSSDEQVKKRLVGVDLSKKDWKRAGGLPVICNGRYAYVDAGDSHTAIMASSGQKKSTCAFLPIISSLIRSSMPYLAVDPKGELYAKTSGEAKNQDYHVIALNFRTMDMDGYNILELAARLYRSGDTDKGESLLSDIINVLMAEQMSGRIDPYWPRTAGMFCGGTGNVMFESFPTLDSINISNWAKFNTESAAEDLKKLVSGIDSENTSLINLRSVLAEPEKTLMSTLSTASSFFSPFIQNNKLARMLSHSTFDLNDLITKKVAIYLITDDTTTTYDPIVGIIISQIQTFLVSAAYKMKDGRLKNRFNFVLDEFTSFPIPNMENALATHRGRNIRYFLCIQSIAGLRRRYEHYEAILANCGNLLFMGSTERELLDRVVDQCGTTRITSDGRERPLISVPELMSLEQTWDYKQCVYLNLSDSIRYVTKLPSYETYGIGRTSPCEIKREFPKVESYSPERLLRDVYNGYAKRPFTDSAEEIYDEDDAKEGFGGTAYTASILKKSLEQRFDELFGSIDFDKDTDENTDEDNED